MKYITLILVVVSIITLSSAIYADLPIPEKLSVKEATWRNDDNIRTLPQQQHETQEWAGDTLPIPERIPLQDAIFPPIAYQQPVFVPTRSQIAAWQRQQAWQQAAYWQRVAYAQQQQAAWQQHAAYQQAMFAPPVHDVPQVAAVFPPMPDVLVEHTPVPPQPSAQPTAAPVQSDPQQARIVLETEHSKTDAQLPATLTQEQKAMINDLVAQQLAAEQDQHTRTITAEQVQYEQEGQRLRFLSLLAVTFFLVMGILLHWTGRRFLNAFVAVWQEWQHRNIV